VQGHCGHQAFSVRLITLAREPGSQFGPYLIKSLVGVGGMGEVYRARDTRLNRDVALKFLHPGADIQRFEREAQVIAALNHPNIVAIYDVGEDYLVTELVDGKPLRSLKPSLREAVDWAAQIADGLAAAHAAGITHRDLKPDNVMVTGAASGQPGRVKILDFGLAHHARSEVLGETDATRTVAGTVMGTAGYMSPEQVRGQPADARSDIFSFGATVYEMLSGRPPFAAETAVQTMSAVIEREPAPLPELVPPGLRSIVGRCLEKEPARRFQSAFDLAYSLRALSGSTIAAMPVETPRLAGRRLRLALAASGIGLILLAAAWMLRPWQPDLAAYRFVPFATEEYPEYGAAWSPDGRSIAYSAIADHEYRILMKSVAGGLPTIVARHPMSGATNVVAGLSWSADGSRLYYVFLAQAWSVARTGGTPEPLKLGDLNSRVRSVAAAPDGSGLAFSRGALDGNRIVYSLWFAPVNGSPPVKMAGADQRPLVNLAWAPDSSHLLASEDAASGEDLFLVARNGGAHRLLEGEFQRTLFTAWLPEGRYALVTSSHSNLGIRMVDTRSGNTRAVLPTSTPVGAISVSPDGGRIACTMGVARTSIMEIPLDGSAPHPFLKSRAENSELAWSPDGTEFAYVYDEEIRIRNRAGTAERTVVSHRDFPGYRGTLQFEKPSFSPDGQRLLYTLFGVQGHGQGVWISPVNGGPPAVVEQAAGYAPLWTSNGTAILVNPSSAAANSARAFGGGIWRYRLGGSDTPEQIFPGTCDPAPSPDGKWMICPASQAGMTLVSLETKEARVLSSERMATAAFSQDGGSIYAVRPAGDKPELVRVDVGSGRVQTLSTLPPDFAVGGPFGGPTRMVLSPDGKSLFTTVRRNEGDIWILEGFNPPRSFWER